jgi:hypothetical protein
LKQQLASQKNSPNNTTSAYSVLIAGTKNDLANTMSNIEKTNLIQKVCQQFGSLNIDSVNITSAVNGTNYICLSAIYFLNYFVGFGFNKLKANIQKNGSVVAGKAMSSEGLAPFIYHALPFVETMRLMYFFQFLNHSILKNC